jgi:hypothetical protein
MDAGSVLNIFSFNLKMKICGLLLTLIFRVNFLSAQSFRYPVILERGEQITSFIPTGWSILDSVTGDLNRDGYRDVTLVLQYDEKITSVEDRGGFFDTIRCQPRILCIALGDSAFFKKQEQSNSFVLCYDNPSSIDPFEGLDIRQDTLLLYFSYMSSFIISTTYSFVYQNAELELILANRHSIHRGSHDYEVYSFDFAKRKLIIKNGNDDGSLGSPYSEEKDLPPDALRNLKTYIQPYSWEIIPGYFL